MAVVESIEKLAERQRRGRAEPKWLDVTSSGRPKPSYPNARTAIEASGDLSFAYDAFGDRGYVSGDRIPNGRAPLADQLVADIRQRIVDEFGFDAGKDHVFDAALQLCHEHRFDPVCDYLNGLRWDGQARVDHWLVNYLGAEDTPLNRAFGRKTLLAAVRRARQPGCKFDTMLVLEGSQGAGKSSAVRVLAGNDALFSDQDLLHGGTREQQELLAGVWLYEIGELAGMQRTEIEKIKAFASRTHDRARPAYGRLRIDQPRRCIFIATTNQSQFLRDHTGNRRFWPIRVSTIRLADLASVRDQLWAEAVAIDDTGESLFLGSDLWGDAKSAQEARLEDDPWTEVLANLRPSVISPDGDQERLTFADVMERLSIPPERQTNMTARRVTEVLARLGWEKAKPFKIDGKTARGYTRAATSDVRCN